jgi:hypothetical protein
MTDKIIDVPGAGQISFPASMSDGDIESAIKTHILPTIKGQADVRGDGAASIDRGLSQAFGQGSTLGYGDEITAAIRAALPGLSDWMMKGPAIPRDESIGGTPEAQTVSAAPTYGERYNEELARERGKAQQFHEEHPALATGANIAGNLATSAIALPAAPAGATVLGNAARYGAYGGLLGGVQGFGEGEGGFLNRVSNAGPGAAFGAIGGAAAPVAGQAVHKLAQSPLGQFAAEKVISPSLGKLADVLEASAPKVAPGSFGAAGVPGSQVPLDSVRLRLADALRGASNKTADISEQGAVQQIAKALGQSKLTGEAAAGKMAALGDPAMLADLGGGFRRSAVGAKVLEPEIQTHAENVLTARDVGTGQRMTGAFTEGRDVPSMSQAQNFLAAHKSAVGADLYGQMRQAGLAVSPEMEQMALIPAVKDAISKVQADAVRTGTELNPVDVMHRVKQKLNDTAEAAFSSGVPINKQDVANLANRWENEFWQANVKAHLADQGYAHAASLSSPRDMGHLETGRQFMRTGTSETAQEVSPTALYERFSGASPQQKLAFQTGATNAAREMANQGTNSARALARKLGPDAIDLTDKILQIYGPEKGQQILKQAAAERTFADTSNALLRGSQTTEKSADAAAMGNSVLKISPEGVKLNIWEHAADLVNKLEEPNKRVIGKVGELMLNPDPEKNREILALADALLKSKARTSGAKAAATTAAGQAAGTQ